MTIFDLLNERDASIYSTKAVNNKPFFNLFLLFRINLLYLQSLVLPYPVSNHLV